MKRKKIFAIGGMVLVAILTVAICITAFYGYSDYYGPFRNLSIMRIKSSYPVSEYQEGIVFYGASNFRKWDNMQEDMSKYGYDNVCNAGFGGAMDEDLIAHAEEILFPYNPKVVFLQTGSNDYVYGGLSIDDAFAQKIDMYKYFAKNLPTAKFIVMSGLPIPAHADLLSTIQAVNERVKDYCEYAERFFYVDADSVMLNNGQFIPEYYVDDMIHLNQKGHDAWTPLMIQKLKEIGY